jgi:ribosomal protein S18 acetylase RimI-like enzyme
MPSPGKKIMIIRPYQANDRNAVISVCHRTGYFGEDAAPHFKDAELFGLLFAAYYIEYEPENCFVTDDNGKAVGYIIGSVDTTAQREAFDRIIVPRIVRRAFTKTLFCHPGDVIFLLGLTDHADYERLLYTPDLVARYPAHLHMNVLPNYQRHGVGTALIECFLERMKKAKVPGVHLVTSTENKKALPFYHKEGFSLLRELPGKLWEKKSPPGAQSLVYGKIL